MCPMCWYGYGTKKWRAAENSAVEWRRNYGKTVLEKGSWPKYPNPDPTPLTKEDIEHYTEWANEPFVYDEWFETQEFKDWCEKDKHDYYIEPCAQAVNDYHEGRKVLIYTEEAGEEQGIVSDEYFQAQSTERKWKLWSARNIQAKPLKFKIVGK